MSVTQAYYCQKGCKDGQTSTEDDACPADNLLRKMAKSMHETVGGLIRFNCLATRRVVDEVPVSRDFVCKFGDPFSRCPIWVR